MKLSKKEEELYNKKFDAFTEFCEEHKIPALVFVPIDEEGYSILFNEGQEVVSRFARVCLEGGDTSEVFSALVALAAAAKSAVDKKFFMVLMASIYEASTSNDMLKKITSCEEEFEDELNNPNADC